jgi:hypothetical protein
VNLQTDSANCGGCGLGCSAGCDAGRCLIALVSGQTAMRENSFAIDAVNAYWGAQYFNTSTGGAVLSVPLTGGPVSTLAAQQNFPSGIVAGGTIVYWANSNEDATGVASIEWAEPGPGYSGTLVSGFGGNPGPIALDPYYVYWADVNGGVTHVRKVSRFNAPDAAPLAAEMTALFGIAVDRSYVYFTGLATGDILAVALDGGTPVEVVRGQDRPWGLVADGTALYWTTLAGTVATTHGVDAGSKILATKIGTGTWANLAVDGSYVYWTSGRCDMNAGPCPSVMKVPIEGGPVTTLASDLPDPEGIAVDATSVYWADPTVGAIMKLTPK